jgi:hypothetical protein
MSEHWAMGVKQGFARIEGKPWFDGVTARSGQVVELHDHVTGETFYSSDCSYIEPLHIFTLKGRLEKLDLAITETGKHSCKLGDAVAEVSKERLMEALRRGMLVGQMLTLESEGLILNKIVLGRGEEESLTIKYEAWQQELRGFYLDIVGVQTRRKPHV